MFPGIWWILFLCPFLMSNGVRVKVTDEQGRSIKSKYRSLPGKLKVNVTMNGENIGLTLDRNLDQTEKVPMYVLRSDLQGNQNYDVVETNLNVTLYQDTANGATFGVVHNYGKSGSSFKVKGLFHKDNMVYELTSSTFTDDGTEDDVYRISSHHDVESRTEEEFELRIHDNPISPDHADQFSNPFRSAFGGAASSAHKRNVRTVTQDVHVDVVALADYGIYQAWYSRSDGSSVSEKRQNAFDSIYEYYAFVYNGVNMMYKSITTLTYTIHMKVTTIIVASDGHSSPWTELGRESRAGSEYDVTNASAALNNLTDWAGHPGNHLPPYDHLQLFTGYDLTNDAGNTVTTGLAWTATLCETNGSASSVIEDLGGFHCVNTAAHEIAHTLSANHDGFDNSCDSGDGYIMSSGLFTITDANKRNRWFWSGCSIHSIDTFFQQLSTTAHGRHCLYTTGTASHEVPDVTSSMPGQVYNVDQQCQQIHGANASFCRGINIGDWSNVCTAMWCLKPLTDNYCGREVAARGTTCADHKWCIDGECVYDAKAPATPDNCTMPDQPGAVKYGKTCIELILDPDNCNLDYIHIRCCKACSTVDVPPRIETSTTTAKTPATAQHGNDVDSQCQRLLGSQSSWCRGINIGDVSNVCGALWCLTPGSDGYCNKHSAANHTTCGNHQWCVGGQCVHDFSAPSVNDGCLFPDQQGLVANDMNCTGLVTHLPRKCYQDYVRTRCCHHCAATHIPTSDPNHTPASQMPGQQNNVDHQCQRLYGSLSSFCRGIKLNNVSEVCASLWCLQPNNNNFCNPEVADDGTTCGHHMWCMQGHCVHNGHAPAVLDGCPFPDQAGAVSNGLTCAQLVANDATHHCSDSYVLARCCKACAAAAATRSAVQASATTSTTTIHHGHIG